LTNSIKNTNLKIEHSNSGIYSSKKGELHHVDLSRFGIGIDLNRNRDKVSALPKGSTTTLTAKDWDYIS
jgi:hypothetical protein